MQNLKVSACSGMKVLNLASALQCLGVLGSTSSICSLEKHLHPTVIEVFCLGLKLARYCSLDANRMKPFFFAMRMNKAQRNQSNSLSTKLKSALQVGNQVVSRRFGQIVQTCSLMLTSVSKTAQWLY